MSDNDYEQYKTLRAEFHKVTKRILQKRDLSTNPETLYQYVEDLIRTYNDIVTFIKPLYHTFKDTSKESIVSDLKKNYASLVECFKKLPAEISTPANVLTTVFIVREINAGASVSSAHAVRDNESQSDDGDSRDDLIQSLNNLSISRENNQIETNANNNNILLPRIQESQTENDQIELNPPRNVNNNLNNLNDQNHANMATIEAKTSFIKTCSHYISAKYSGDPNTLESFID